MQDIGPIAVVGGGFTGLAAAYDLAASGRQVEIFEEEDSLGGLAGTFEISPGIRIEKFYHHWFTSDQAILSLVEELGLSAQLKYITSNTGLYYANSIFRLASPVDLLRFPAIPLIDRIRTGLMALTARRISDWRRLENLSAEEWLIKTGGRKSFEVIWKPLLKGKFGPEASNVSAVWVWNKLKLRGSSRNKRGSESLVYFKGSFGSFCDSITEKLRRMGVRIHLNSRVDEIVTESGGVKGIKCGDSLHPARLVLATVPLPVFLRITPGLPAEYRSKAGEMRFLGNVCLVLRLTHSLSSTYWLNVADPSFPFVGIIEHTNFDDIANYGGEHIAYISKYLPTSDALFSMQDQEYFQYCLPFIQRMFPAFSPEWVKGYKLWRAHYSQPVVTRNYSSIIPGMQTPLRNLWLCSMGQIYPEDRGTNYAVQYGREAARRIIASLS